MDARYTGHLYRLVTQATDFARRQPRKHLWERNSYFYIPAIHGTWEEFTAKVNRDMVKRDSIWGPRPAEDIDLGKHRPVPPVASPDDDEGDWGVGEDADLITWLPHFDPAGVNWPWGQEIYHFQQQEHTPRRATVGAMSRLSTRLLRVMHKDQACKGLGLASEMMPISWAMYYGLKAVQVPQPVYHERAWDPSELDHRANSEKTGKINGDLNSAWGYKSCDDILLYTSFMWRSSFAERLYRAWLGYDGAEEVSDIWPLTTFDTKRTCSGKRKIVLFVFRLSSFIRSRTQNHKTSLETVFCVCGQVVFEIRSSTVHQTYHHVYP